MPCDHLPFETQPEMTKSDKRKQGKRYQSASWPQVSDEESGDECDRRYEPLPVPMPPSVTNERHTELEIESEPTIFSHPVCLLSSRCEPKEVTYLISAADCFYSLLTWTHTDCCNGQFMDCFHSLW